MENHLVAVACVHIRGVSAIQGLGLRGQMHTHNWILSRRWQGGGGGGGGGIL